MTHKLLKIALLSCIMLTAICMTETNKETKLQFPTYDKSWEESKLFYTKFLAEAEEVREYLLKHENFKEVSYTTPDNLKIESLVRIPKEKSQFSIVISAGFFPGLMTGMASLIKMLPEDCTIIIYNGRGKGKSEGSSIAALWNFGMHEYKDVIGALDYAKSLDKDAPVVVYGTCAGTFTNTKAICHLYQDNKLEEYNIRAHVMDSTVSDLPTTIERLPSHQRRKDNWFVAILRTIFLWSLRYTIFPRCFMTSGEDAQLDPKLLAQTKIPTLHYDCKKGDFFTLFETTDGFYKEHLKNMSDDPEKCKKHTFDKSSHANHLLIHKKEYAAVLAKFMSQHVGDQVVVRSRL